MMELSAEQERRLAALRDRRPVAVTPVTTLVSTLDVRASESARLVTSAVAFLAVSAGILALRGTDSPVTPTVTTWELRASQPAPTAAFTLRALIPATATTNGAPIVPAEPSTDPTDIDTARVDSITQGT